MREYEPIWNELKQKKRASISASRALHKRIIKAVTKEKWMDTAFKLQIYPKHALMFHSRKGSVITFELRLYLDLTKVTIGDV